VLGQAKLNKTSKANSRGNGINLAANHKAREERKQKKRE
jgi:hypothetical protein